MSGFWVQFGPHHFDNRVFAISVFPSCRWLSVITVLYRDVWRLNCSGFANYGSMAHMPPKIRDSWVGGPPFHLEALVLFQLDNLG